jgi:hypothetical protein
MKEPDQEGLPDRLGPAYNVLNAEAPETLSKIVPLLKQHPDRGRFKLDAVAAEDRDLLLFILAARWPDGSSRQATAPSAPRSTLLGAAGRSSSEPTG